VLRDQGYVKKLEDLLKKPPFNTGFGLYLYLNHGESRGVHAQPDALLKDIVSNGLREFDVYRISENLNPDMAKELEAESMLVIEKYRSPY
jgi:hypothetical protein